MTLDKYQHNNNWYCSYCGCNLSFNQCWCNNYFGSKLELTAEDFAAFWQSRPKDKYLGYPKCPIYVFNINSEPKAPCDFVWLDWRYTEPNWASVL